MLKGSGPSLLDVREWIFDLDNTLYPATSSVGVQVSERMTSYIVNQFEINRDDAFKLRRALFHSHGTTLRGLMSVHKIDPHEYLSYVHDIDLSGLAPDPALAEALAALPGRRFVHTNASTDHAERVLEQLGIANLFDAVIDIRASEYLPKPDPFGYHHLLRAHGADPTKAAMVEDMAINLRTAAELGMATVWVDTSNEWARAGAAETWVHHRTDNLASWLREYRDCADVSSIDSGTGAAEFDGKSS